MAVEAGDGAGLTIQYIFRKPEVVWIHADMKVS